MIPKKIKKEPLIKQVYGSLEKENYNEFTSYKTKKPLIKTILIHPNFNDDINSKHQSGVQHCSQIMTRLHGRKLLTLESANGGRAFAHKLRNTCLQLWNVTTLHDENV